jgi:hypothetical protein
MIKAAQKEPQIADDCVKTVRGGTVAEFELGNRLCWVDLQLVQMDCMSGRFLAGISSRRGTRAFNF